MMEFLLQMEKSQKVETKSPVIDLWIKSMLVGRESDGYPVFQVRVFRFLALLACSAITDQEIGIAMRSCSDFLFKRSWFKSSTVQNQPVKMSKVVL